MRLILAAAASAALASCVAALPQGQTGGASGGSYTIGMTSLPAVTDELQVAWTIAPIAARPQTVAVERGILFRTPLLPERLFVADEPVRGADGTTLAPAKTQFLLMDWPTLLVCSLGRDQTGLTGATRKVCLLDENGDGAPDTYFRGSGDFAGWYVMNRRMPAARNPLQRVTWREIEPSTLARKPEFRLRVASWPQEGRDFVVQGDVDGETGFSSGCAEPAGPAGTCVVPPIAIVGHAREPGRDMVTIVGAGKAAKLRFSLAYGMIAGANVTGVRVYFDEASASASR